MTENYSEKLNRWNAQPRWLRFLKAWWLLREVRLAWACSKHIFK